jgi:hypothetical protein
MSEAPLISIVDDDALARDGIRELVESLGYNAVTFASAEHFLQSGVIAHANLAMFLTSMARRASPRTSTSCRSFCAKRKAPDAYNRGRVSEALRRNVGVRVWFQLERAQRNHNVFDVDQCANCDSVVGIISRTSVREDAVIFLS